jgi:hypothetical protein
VRGEQSKDAGNHRLKTPLPGVRAGRRM